MIFGSCGFSISSSKLHRASCRFIFKFEFKFCQFPPASLHCRHISLILSRHPSLYSLRKAAKAKGNYPYRFNTSLSVFTPPHNRVRHLGWSAAWSADNGCHHSKSCSSEAVISCSLFKLLTSFPTFLRVFLPRFPRSAGAQTPEDRVSIYYDRIRLDADRKR
jgi:hypothetical protein